MSNETNQPIREKIIIIDDGSNASKLLEIESSRFHDVEKVKAKDLADLIDKIKDRLKDDNKIVKIFTHYCTEEYTDKMDRFVNDAKSAYPGLRIANRYMNNARLHIENRAKKYNIGKSVKEKEDTKK